jgi:myo-inositol-1(or 4)-monophosphatase
LDVSTREFAIELACRAGDLLIEILQRGLNHDHTRDKLGHFDIVTEADVASEGLIKAALADAFPGHCVHAEESAGSSLPACEWMWLIDPVDGTTNYAHGLPIFAVNLALARDRQPVLAVTHDPSARRTYWAEAGGGAWSRRHDGGREGRDTRLAVSDVGEISRALLATGFIHGRVHGSHANRAEFTALDIKSQSVRRLGAASMIMAWIAAGCLEGYWEMGLKPWDVAAGWLLITAADGKLTEYDGSPFRLDSPTMIASNGRPGVHETIMATLAEVRGNL